MTLEVQKLKNLLEQRDITVSIKNDVISSLETSLESYKKAYFSTLEILRMKITGFDAEIQVNPHTRSIGISADLLPIASVENSCNFIRPLDLLESNSLLYFRST